MFRSFFLIVLCFQGWISYAQNKPEIHLVEVAAGLSSPVALANAGDNRLFIVERPGIIKIMDGNGTMLSTPFLNITNRVKSTGSEQGLLGLAFHPDYKTNGFFYVNYIGVGDTSHIARFKVSTADANIADPNSEATILKLDQPYTNHNGGDLKFGPDGYLYAGFGDGGSGGDPNNYAQNMSTWLGKMLRLDVSALPYLIPLDNPFAGQSATIRDEIWASGLRNPWRFSFDSKTGDLWIADVGQNAWEEINKQMSSSAGGENYGWRCYEADVIHNSTGCGPAGDYDMPVHKYSNTGFSGDCSVTGGYVYRGSKYPLMDGYYFYGDYCSSKLWSLHDSSGTLVETLHDIYTNQWFSTFGEANDGELYVAGVKSGKLFHIVDTSGVVGIEGLQSRIEALMYPNPANDLLNVDLESAHSKLNLVITDMKGSKMMETDLTSHSNVIDISPLLPGVYLVELKSNDGLVLRNKLIKE